MAKTRTEEALRSPPKPPPGATATVGTAAVASAWLSPSERAAKGRGARREVPRSSHGAWEPASERPDPIALLEKQAETRVPELVPIRYGRMVASPFAFYRGAAYVMASDLADSPRSGIQVQLCGDAHLSNFGLFASPDRDQVFDINDFDETLPGPWEWDVKRLAASVAVATRDRGFKASLCRNMVRGAVAEYRRAMHTFARRRNLDVWYARAGSADLTELVRSQATPRIRKRFEQAAAQTRRKDNLRAFAKLATTVNGSAWIVPDPPLIVPVGDLLPGAEAAQLEQGIRALIDSYCASVSDDLRRLIERFRYADFARKVVGVGSVGTRAWVLLLLGRDSGDPLFLQAKEAEHSVLEPFAGKSEYDNMGRRVVEGQRLMQAASDILLGWLRTTGIDEQPRDFYVRQLWDWKASADIAEMRPEGLALYTRLCGWTLARAHARSGDAIAIAAYLGRSDAFDRAIADFAGSYAEQNDRDHRTLVDAVESGRVAAKVSA